MLTGLIRIVVSLLLAKHVGAVVNTLQHSDVERIASAIGDTFKQISCSTMRTGVGCDEIGLEHLHAAVHTPENGFNEFLVNPQTQWLEAAVSEMSQAFEGAENALRKMASDMEQYLIERLIIEGLKQTDHDQLPKFDASHPHWLEDLESTIVEGTNFFKPVGKSSVLLYPQGVNRDDRQVKASANASVGLEENFMLNVATMDDESPSGASIRWQRFTSKTGVTRSYPAAYDNSAKDHRFEPWFKLCTQVRKKVLIVLDVSETMRSDERFAVAKQVIRTLLRSVGTEDYVQILLTTGQQPELACNSKLGMYPASEENVRELLLFLDGVELGGGLDMLAALGSALEQMDQVRDCPNEEEDGTEDEGGEGDEGGCRERHAAIFLLSDGEFESEYLESWLEQEEQRGRGRGVHVMGVAVGASAEEESVQRISCGLNGIFFRIMHDAGPSAIRTELDEWFQIIAAPLAVARPLDITWTLPRTEDTGKEAHVTWSLPAFTDVEGAVPQLVGAVSIDLCFVTSGAQSKKSLLPVLSGLRLQGSQRQPAPGAAETSLLVTRGYGGVPILNEHLHALYARGIPLALPATARAATLDDYEGAEFRAAGVLERLLTEEEGEHSVQGRRCGHLVVGASAQGWDLRLPRCAPANDTYVWRKVEGHPLTVVLRVPELPAERAAETSNASAPAPASASAFAVRGWQGGAPLTERLRSCALSLSPEALEALRGGNRTCLPPLHASSFSARPLFFSLASHPPPAEAPEATWLLLPHSAFADPFEYQKHIEPWRASLQGSADASDDSGGGGAPATLCTPGAQAASAMGPGSGQTPCEMPPRVRALERLLSGEKLGAEAGEAVLGGGVREGFLSDVATTALLERLWQAPRPAGASGGGASGRGGGGGAWLARFVATRSGVLRGRVAAGARGAATPERFLEGSSLWFRRGAEAVGRVALLPPAPSRFCGEGGGACPRVVTLAAAVRGAEAVVGAEVEYGGLHAALTEVESWTGSRNVSCGAGAYRGEVRCYVINRGGAVVASPGRELGLEGGGDGGRQAVFIGEVEPEVGDGLVKHGLLVPRRTVQPAVLGGSAFGYEAEERVLPLKDLVLAGVVRGTYFVSAVPGVDAFLVVIDNYAPASAPAPAPQCQGQLPGICAPTAPPMLAQEGPGGCQWEVRVAVAATDVLGAARLARMLRVLRLKDLCKTPHPTWVPVLAALAISAAVLALSLRHLRGRLRGGAAGGAAGSEGEGRGGKEAWLAGGGGERKAERLTAIAERRQRVDRLLEQAEDEDDVRQVMREQGELIAMFAAAKQSMQDTLSARLEEVAEAAARKCLLAENLSGRVLLVEQASASPAAVKAAQGEAEAALAAVEDALSDLALPALQVTEDTRSLDGKSAALLAAEQAFYAAFYPHLIEYHTLHTDPGSPRRTNPRFSSPRFPSARDPPSARRSPPAAHAGGIPPFRPPTAPAAPDGQQRTPDPAPSPHAAAPAAPPPLDPARVSRLASPTSAPPRRGAGAAGGGAGEGWSGERGALLGGAARVQRRALEQAPGA